MNTKDEPIEFFDLPKHPPYLDMHFVLQLERVNKLQAELNNLRHVVKLLTEGEDKLAWEKMHDEA